MTGYSITHQRWASIVFFLALMMITIKIVLLGLYAGHEITISATQSDQNGSQVNTATVTILTVLLSLAPEVYLGICCAIILHNPETTDVFYCGTEDSKYYKDRRNCPLHHLYWLLPFLITLIIAFILNIKYFGLLPTSPLQGLVFGYALLTFALISLMATSTIFYLLWKQIRRCGELWCGTSDQNHGNAQV